MGWKIFDEPIAILELRFRYFPDLFSWRGRRYKVHEVERVWFRTKRGRRQLTHRRFFRVQCEGAVFEMFQDLDSGLWQLRRAKLASKPVLAVRHAVPMWQN